MAYMWLKRMVRSAGGTSLLLLLGTASAVHAQDCTDAAATPSVCAFDAAKNAAAKTKIKSVLLFDWSNGGHQRSYTQNHMMRLSQKYGFKLDRSQTQTYITAATLQGIDLIVFNNGDQDPLQNAASLAAVKNFVEKEGKGILVIHAGAAYIPCPSENLENPNCRWLMRGLRTQYWIMNIDNTLATIFADSVVVGEVPPRATGSSAVPATRNHGRMNPETRMIFENLPTNGGIGPLSNRPYIWEGLADEWYNYQNNPRLEGQRVFGGVNFGPINILLSLDENSVASNAGCNVGPNACKNQGTFGDRPVSWTRKIGNGMLAFQSAGHTDVYTRGRYVGITRRPIDSPYPQSNHNVNDSIIEKYNWRLMKYLARDFVGCMEPSDPNYNPEATVAQLHPGFDPPQPCQNPVPVRARITPSQPLVSTGSRTIRVSPGQAGEHSLRIVNVQGQPVFTGRISGQGESAVVEGLEPGIYFLRMQAANGHVTANRIELF